MIVYDEEYVKALEEQAECLAHHLQVVIDMESVSFADIARKIEPSRVVKRYFEFKKSYSND